MVLLILLAGLLPIFVGIFLLVERARARQIEKARRLPRVVIPLTDYALIASPLVVEVLLLLFSISDSFADGLTGLAGGFLELLCATPVPLAMCRSHQPINLVMGVLLGGHLAFLVASALLFARIVLGNCPKPINYDARPASRRVAIVCAVGWVLVFLGGYFFIGRASFFGPLLGAAFAANFCWWLRFGRAAPTSG